MSQTRSIGKAYRNLLAWLISAAGFQATPAEEMEQADNAAPTPRKPPKKEKAPPTPAPPTEQWVLDIGDQVDACQDEDCLKRLWEDLSKDIQKSKLIKQMFHKKKAILKAASDNAS